METVIEGKPIMAEIPEPLSKEERVYSTIHLVGGSGTERISDRAEMVNLFRGINTYVAT